jgi:glycerophosphoryl diester phosphodiesterase
MREQTGSGRTTLAVGAGALVAAAVVLLGVVMAGSDDERQTPDGAAPSGTPDTPQGHTDAGMLVIAHRGASAYAPHDTVAAARAAVRRGADAVEADVRQTRDGHLVTLFHGTLAPSTDAEQVFPGRRPWRVEDFTLAEIRRLDAGSWFSRRFAGERVPTLGELADALAGTGVRLIVEPKSPARYPGIGARIAREVRTRPDLYLEVECFEQALLRRLSQRSVPVDLGVTGTPPKAGLDRIRAFADAVNPRLASVDRAYVERAHAAGLGVKVWSLNDRASIRRALALRVDGIYSHRPDLVNAMLEAR